MTGVEVGATPGSVKVTYVPRATYPYPGSGNWIGVALLSSGLTTCNYAQEWSPAAGTGWTGYIPGTAGVASTYEFSSVTMLTEPSFVLVPDEQYIFCLMDQDSTNGYGVGDPMIGPGSGGGGGAPEKPIPMWVQAFARADKDAPCPDGWASSWDTWPNEGEGGFVCQRSIKSFGN